LDFAPVNAIINIRWRRCLARYDFELLSELYAIETIAKGNSVEQRAFLNRRFGRGHWRKMKGRAIIRYSDGRVMEAEIHWFEAHGIGRKLPKAIRDIAT
jgi:hypothetical protein